MSDTKVNALTEQIIGCAFQVSNALGCGFLESVYEHALAHELRLNGLTVDCQAPIQVCYRGIVVGDFRADLLVAGQTIVEVKATREHHEVFTAQCLNYLRATGLPICLLINFGRPRVDVRRYRADRIHEPSDGRSDREAVSRG